jgi:hypothetical protein
MTQYYLGPIKPNLNPLINTLHQALIIVQANKPDTLIDPRRRVVVVGDIKHHTLFGFYIKKAVEITEAPVRHRPSQEKQREARKAFQLTVYRRVALNVGHSHVGAISGS